MARHALCRASDEQLLHGAASMGREHEGIRRGCVRVFRNPNRSGLAGDEGDVWWPIEVSGVQRFELATLGRVGLALDRRCSCHVVGFVLEMMLRNEHSSLQSPMD